MRPDDELHNVNISENAKTKHALDLKKKGKQAGQYTGLDDDEFEDGPGSSARGVLSKYDEDFDAIKVDGFRLGAAPSAAKGKARAPDDGSAVEGGEREKVKLSMDYTSEPFDAPILRVARVMYRSHHDPCRQNLSTRTISTRARPGSRSPRYVVPLSRFTDLLL